MRMPRHASWRGQPLVTLLAILVLWSGVRTVLWQSPFPAHAVTLSASDLGHGTPQGRSRRRGAAPNVVATPAAIVVQAFAAPSFQPFADRGTPLFVPPPFVPDKARPAPLLRPVTLATAAGHQLLWMAALSGLPLPGALRTSPQSPSTGGGIGPLAVRNEPRAPRWSADGWLLVRSGSGAADASGALPSYGGSQAGAVLRYRLSPGEPHGAALYLRGSAALAGPRDREAAFGFSGRAIAAVPLVVMAELRLTDQQPNATLRPAVAVVSELPPFRLPAKLRGEAYGQAGYVGGRGATAFIDGQLKVDRAVAEIGPAEVRVGGGAWGGAQRDAARLDLGPAATVISPIRNGSARLALDYRFRVAGNAAPASGPALTLSAGF